MDAKDEREMHGLACRLEQLTKGEGWEASRYIEIGRVMEKLAEYCAVCDCKRKAQR